MDKKGHRVVEPQPIKMNVIKGKELK